MAFEGIGFTKTYWTVSGYWTIDASDQSTSATKLILHKGLYKSSFDHFCGYGIYGAAPRFLGIVRRFVRVELRTRDRKEE